MISFRRLLFFYHGSNIRSPPHSSANPLYLIHHPTDSISFVSQPTFHRPHHPGLAHDLPDEFGRDIMVFGYACHMAADLFVRLGGSDGVELADDILFRWLQAIPGCVACGPCAVGCFGHFVCFHVRAVQVAAPSVTGKGLCVLPALGE